MWKHSGNAVSWTSQQNVKFKHHIEIKFQGGSIVEDEVDNFWSSQLVTNYLKKVINSSSMYYVLNKHII